MFSRPSRPPLQGQPRGCIVAAGPELLNVRITSRLDRGDHYNRCCISLAELRERTGIGRSALSRLENDPEANRTITTLARVAEALGKQIVIQLVEKPGG
jgi:transcriptional regulator with XRE-family HTH domain